MLLEYKMFRINCKLIILAASVISVMLSSCGEYSKILKSKDQDFRYLSAKNYYNKGKFDKAFPLFEDVLAAWKGQEKSEEVYYYYCYTHYGMGNMNSASFHFKNFTETFFTSKKLEECAFMHAHAEYDMALPHQLDQTQTYKAINELQLFINMHPKSSFVDSSNTLMDNLRKQLITKDFNLAKLYFDRERYNSAIRSFENFLRDYPEIENRDEIEFFILRTNQKLAENSVEGKKLERWQKTEELAKLFALQYGGNNKYMNKVKSILLLSQKKIKLIQK